MPWNNETGNGGRKGPWGSGGNGSGGSGDGGRGPWGAGPGGGRGGGRGPGGGPPNFEDIIRRGQSNVRRFLPGGLGSPRGIILVAIIAVVIWMLSGLYRVNPEEVGVELIFGEHVATTQQGLHWNWPAPIGDVITPNVTRENTTEVGFRTAPGREEVRGIREEAEMLTGDENIIDIHVVVFWRIDQRPTQMEVDGETQTVTTQGVTNYLFNIRNPEQGVKDVTEAALREIVGRNQFETIRTTGRGRIEDEARELIQGVLDDYGAGIQVLRVKLQKIDPPANVLSAFRDVQAARADQQTKINEATRYQNQVVPQAQGRAEQIIREAEAFRQERIANARGETQRFLSVLEQYQQNQQVTRRRIYMETMREVLRDMDKIMITGREGTGVLPYLPLRELQNRQSTDRVPGQSNRTTGRDNVTGQGAASSSNAGTSSNGRN